ncbi:hypothetical protein IGB42_00560 [Andreprevotia sp. IGB-42]|nr:hypothetical protein IGB42_00560 [Andreprevotia sp. IGB-42]
MQAFAPTDGAELQVSFSEDESWDLKLEVPTDAELPVAMATPAIAGHVLPLAGAVTGNVSAEESRDLVLDAAADAVTPQQTVAGAEHSSAAPAIVAPEPQPEAPFMLDEAAIHNITASVGAQLAVDIASEVEQLTRQHFSALVNTLYGETLRKLTAEIAHDLDQRLAPRISELVQDELRRQKLLR